MLRTNAELVVKVKTWFTDQQPNNLMLREYTDWSFDRVQYHLQTASNERIFSTSRRGGLHSFSTTNGYGASMFKNFKELRTAVHPDLDERYQWRNDIENTLFQDFLYHWIDNFTEYQTWEMLDAKLQDTAAGLSIATVMFVNSCMVDGYPDTRLRKALKDAKYNWISRGGFWVPTKFYNQDSSGGAAIYTKNSSMFSGGRLQPFTLVLSVDIQRYVNASANARASSQLLSYNTKATDYLPFKSEHKKQHTTFLGVELELENYNVEAATALATLKEHAIMKRDGSLTQGVEICTAPATLNLHKEAFKPFFEANKTLEAKTNCGLHVHVGREFLTQGQIYRIQSFLNDVRNESLVRSVARRYDNNYCRFKPHLAKFTTKDKHSTERYEALNVTNAETIEFRIFRGSLRYESVMAALEFVNALLTFCTPGEVSLTQFTAIGFKGWLLKPERKQENKFLRSYLSLDGANADEQTTTAAAA